MTYETDSGGWKGLRWRRDDDTVVTMRSGIAKHFVASLTTLATAASNREARVRDYYEFKRTAVEEGRTGKIRRFVILPGRNPGHAAELVENLVRAGIEVQQATAAFRSTRAHDYSSQNSPATSRDFPAGAYVVDLAQPQKRLAKALLEMHTPLDPAFAREQLARFERNERRSSQQGRLRLLRHHFVVAAARLRRRGLLDGGRAGRQRHAARARAADRDRLDVANW